MFIQKIQKLPYSAFAEVYDKTMYDIPYHHWAHFIYQVLDSAKLNSQSWVMDIGSGTGLVASKLSSHYRMLAVDISRDMLAHAANERGLTCIQANMTALPLRHESIAAAYSTHDCVNYLSDEKMLLDHLKDVCFTLKPGGIYIFDFSTEYNVIKYFDKRIFSERHGNSFMKWYNVYDGENKQVLSTIDITQYPTHILGRFFFWKKKIIREIHLQKIFDEKLVERLSRKAGFKVLKKNYDYNEITSPQRAHLVVLVLKKL
ncbi:MAG: class I SAM-dependent methyltransferase [Spirochaetia bacterium]|nr:class I SAM-dependent methyltransferase [Spirochaetia bacterium]